MVAWLCGLLYEWCAGRFVVGGGVVCCVVLVDCWHVCACRLDGCVDSVCVCARMCVSYAPL